MPKSTKRTKSSAARPVPAQAEVQAMDWRGWLDQNIVYIAWVQALVATLGSLSFSEIFHFTPCVLCWYQRVCMYPLVVILTVAIVTNDRKRLPAYILPLSLVGLAISIFHNLLYYSIIPEAAAPCREGVSCTTKYIAWFGFITIPFLSMVAFTVITICMIWLWRRKVYDNRVA